MLEKMKEFVERELAHAEEFCETAQEVRQCMTVAFGSVQFMCNCYPDLYNEIDAYWYRMRSKFISIAADK